MTAEEKRQSDFVTHAREFARMVFDGWVGLAGLQKQWNAGAYGVGAANEIPTATTGENEGITAAQVGSAVFDTADALTTLMNTGHATNLERIL